MAIVRSWDIATIMNTWQLHQAPWFWSCNCGDFVMIISFSCYIYVRGVVVVDDHKIHIFQAYLWIQKVNPAATATDGTLKKKWNRASIARLWLPSWHFDSPSLRILLISLLLNILNQNIFLLIILQISKLYSYISGVFLLGELEKFCQLFFS